jgi:hypothetical protein
MSHILINKFQRQQEKARGREEWVRHNEGHLRCLFFKYCWGEGIKLRKAKKCPECNEPYSNSNSSERVFFNDRSPMTWITVNSAINRPQFIKGCGARPASMIGWGVRPMFMIDWEAESMNSQEIGEERWPILWFLMKISCAELLNVDTLCNWTVKSQADYIGSLIHNDVQMA